eukprot:1598589-Rhodomonas_salina.4
MIAIAAFGPPRTLQAIQLLQEPRGAHQSRSLSYAHLVWALAYEKAHNVKCAISRGLVASLLTTVLQGFWDAHSTAVAVEGFTVYRTDLILLSSLSSAASSSEHRLHTGAWVYKRAAILAGVSFVIPCFH